MGFIVMWHGAKRDDLWVIKIDYRSIVPIIDNLGNE